MDQMQTLTQHTPTLAEMLDDPIVVAVMRRDGISREHVVDLIARVRRNLRDRHLRSESLAA
ncbi:hypothetical protein [Azospirillum halopraeferens]|uniref:hypothetical protein n=1 Tax=Azospirillum halopraeferens TaxID=34010 RepID=UPI000415A4C0|nr:hypothetical protein [Azospirillum halopraeferens]